MRNQKGFTIVEVLIVVVIAFIIGIFVFAAVSGLKGGNYCDMYRYSSMSDVPASCVDYFLNGDGSQK